MSRYRMLGIGEVLNREDQVHYFDPNMSYTGFWKTVTKQRDDKPLPIVTKLSPPCRRFVDGADDDAPDLDSQIEEIKKSFRFDRQGSIRQLIVVKLDDSPNMVHGSFLTNYGHAFDSYEETKEGDSVSDMFHDIVKVLVVFVGRPWLGVLEFDALDNVSKERELDLLRGVLGSLSDLSKREAGVYPYREKDTDKMGLYYLFMHAIRSEVDPTF